ncbi:Gyl1p NDAI_0I00720 [Naumovozyma dairenensis CBS 421]|uniref:Rab-GAP TBC domain-containing protein n=1 Tax=Naumovozyma dairenensis (strain ATCC 10597 / BCRC 20456 / CBS 421 / NBRC 0211 / NRRL Y-12639) TaxID=1071378 RepID=G0WFT0_NAUDC|nr:hypothetical protein NDAI_0I00720 [Naumovozyma dairenensis CBS 421]CCD26641.1 hypothetical protein NDAI_0I00720 [Naumovozyma dairenensis CBS 421]
MSAKEEEENIKVEPHRRDTEDADGEFTFEGSNNDDDNTKVDETPLGDKSVSDGEHDSKQEDEDEIDLNAVPEEQIEPEEAEEEEEDNAESNESNRVDEPTIGTSFSDVDLTRTPIDFVQDHTTAKAERDIPIPIPNEIVNQTNRTHSEVEHDLKNITAPGLPPRKSIEAEAEAKPDAEMATPSLPPVLPPRTNLEKNLNEGKNEPGLTPSPSPSSMGTKSGPSLPPRKVPPPPIEGEQSSLPPPPLPHRAATTLLLQNYNKMHEQTDQKFELPIGFTITDENVPKIWIQFIQAPEFTLDNHGKALYTELITNGISTSIRPIVWQCFSNVCTISKDEYNSFIQGDTDNNNNDDSSKVRRIIDAYLKSNNNLISYSSEMDSYVAPILEACSNDDELHTFSLFTKLMDGYGLKGLYHNNVGMGLLLYYYGRSLEMNCPDLYNYLIKVGIKSNMYAKDWFLTCFGNVLKFDSLCKARILDVIFAEGLNCLVRFAVIPMIKNESKLMDLEFDSILTFIKEQIFLHYYENGESTEEDKVDMDNSQEVDTASVVHINMNQAIFNIDRFIEEAMNEIELTPMIINNFTNEYEEIHRMEKEKEEAFEMIKSRNMKLQRQVHKLEADYTALNREHVMMANELVKNKLNIAGIEKENLDLRLEVVKIKKQIEEEINCQKAQNNDDAIPKKLEQEIEATLKKNEKVMRQNLVFQDKINELERQVEEIKIATENGVPLSGEVDSRRPAILGSGWQGIRKVFK